MSHSTNLPTLARELQDHPLTLTGRDALRRVLRESGSPIAPAIGRSRHSDADAGAVLGYLGYLAFCVVAVAVFVAVLAGSGAWVFVALGSTGICVALFLVGFWLDRGIAKRRVEPYTRIRVVTESDVRVEAVAYHPVEAPGAWLFVFRPVTLAVGEFRAEDVEAAVERAAQWRAEAKEIEAAACNAWQQEAVGARAELAHELSARRAEAANTARLIDPERPSQR